MKPRGVVAKHARLWKSFDWRNLATAVRIRSGLSGDFVRRKTKEKISSIFIAVIFLFSMVLFGYNYYSTPKQKTIELKNIYDRPLTQLEKYEALRRYKTIVTFEHPKDCCQDIVSFLNYLPEYSNGEIIYCDVTSQNRTIRIESYNGIEILQDDEVTNRTLVLDKLCSVLIFRDRIPECLT